MWFLFLSAVIVYYVDAGPATENYKDQYCTDPRTLKKHAAYSEWADAYSCTRHRCQPGGRSLAIYSVGCKRVEAPESAIECEEVVEDTNMQFPYCCTRLRCLVVVRGEVWTRVLGQPWESLPAAPWSHMYKIKKPPPPDASFLSKNPGEGPIYELAPESGDEGQGKAKHANPRPDGVEDTAPHMRAAETPDIVIALSTANDNDAKVPENINSRRQMAHKQHPHTKSDECTDNEAEESRNTPGEKSKPRWAQIQPSRWDGENEAIIKTENAAKNTLKSQETFPEPAAENKRADSAENKDEKPLHLQALVDAIGTRMRDIENVVQRMSNKVNTANTMDEPKPDFSNEKKYSDRNIIIPQDADTQATYGDDKKNDNAKRPNQDGENYKRFSTQNRNKYILTSNDPVTEVPLLLEDAQAGYFSGAASILRRGVPPKEPSEPAVYMAPVVETRRSNAAFRSRIPLEISDEQESKAKHKRAHKKKKKPMAHRKRHRPREVTKSFNQISSSENLISSPEDNSSS